MRQIGWNGSELLSVAASWHRDATDDVGELPVGREERSYGSRRSSHTLPAARVWRWLIAAR
jgi:hypothetical protein